MLTRFVMNGYLWQVKFVSPYNPILIDRTGAWTIGVTDVSTLTVYLADNLHGSLLNRVLIHELGHCALFSFGLIDDIHRMVKKSCWLEAEEWCCNLLADYGHKVFGIAYSVLGDEAIKVVPYHLEELIA